MPAAPTIREYLPSDEPNLRRAIAHLHDHVVALDPIRRLRHAPGYVDHEFADTMDVVARQNGRIYVADVDGAFAGCVAGFTTQQSETNLLSVVPTSLGVISDVYVVPDRRRGGVGRQLMRHMEEYLRAAGCDSLWITIVAFNEEAHAFYRSLGYGEREIGLLKTVT